MRRDNERIVDLGRSEKWGNSEQAGVNQRDSPRQNFLYRRLSGR
jgi:hypothetical protein